MKKISVGMVALILLAGCSSAKYKAPKYKENLSRAQNIMHAGNLHTGIEDQWLEPDQAGSLTSDLITGGLFTAAGAGSAFTSVNGLNPLQSAGLNLLLWGMRPESDGANNAIVAFMPHRMAATAEEAQRVFMAMVKQSLKEVLESKGAKIFDEAENDKKTIFAYQYLKKEWGCAGTKNCFGFITIRRPFLGESNPKITGKKELVWAFSVKSNRLNKIEIEGFGKEDAADTPQYDILKAVSKDLPSWAFIYLAPKKVLIGKNEPLKIPVLLEKGEERLFINPKSLKQ